MISKVSRPVAKQLSRTQAVAKKAPALAKRPAQSVSRFEPVTGKQRPKVIDQQHRRETVSTLWNLRNALRRNDKAAATDEAKRLATRLGVAVGSATRTAKSILSIIGRQLLHPEYRFQHPRQLGDYVHCAYRSPSGKPNDPDPTSAVRWSI